MGISAYLKYFIYVFVEEKLSFVEDILLFVENMNFFTSIIWRYHFYWRIFVSSNRANGYKS